MARELKITKEKRETAERFLSEQFMIVHLDPRLKGVKLPESLMNSTTVSLKVSRHFRGEMELTDESITAHLLFDNAYFCCAIPWGAIWGMTSAQGTNVVWSGKAPELETAPRSLPAEHETTSESSAEAPPSGKGQRKKTTAGHLKLVK